MSSGSDFADSIKDSFAVGGIDLLFALHDVEGDDGSVGESTGKGTTNHTFEVIGGIVYVTHDFVDK